MKRYGIEGKSRSELSPWRLPSTHNGRDDDEAFVHQRTHIRLQGVRRGRAILLKAILAAPLANFLHPRNGQLDDFQLEIRAQSLVVKANGTREAIQR